MTATVIHKQNRVRPPLLKITRPAPELQEKVGRISAFFYNNYRKMGPIYRYARGDSEFVALSGPEANQFIQQYGREYLSGEVIRALQVEELGIDRIIVSMGGDEHYQMRKKLKQGFSRSVINGKYERLDAICRHSLRAWQPGARIQLDEALSRAFMDPLSYGVITHTSEHLYDDIIYFVRRHVAATGARAIPMSETRKPKYLAAKSNAIAFADEVLQAHRTGAVESRPTPDLVDEILAIVADDPTFMSDQEIKTTMILGIYIGGLDTMAYTTGFLLYSLLKHPDYMARVRADVDEAFSDGILSPSKIRHMTNLRHALYETMRLYPVSGVLQYTAAKPFEFQGYHVDEGATLMLASMVPHLIPECYPDPFKFDIDRYQAPRNEHQKVGVHVPYGIGPHTCLGAGVADVLILMMTAIMLHSVEFELDPHDQKLDIQNNPLPYPNNLNICITKRRN